MGNTEDYHLDSPMLSVYHLIVRFITDEIESKSGLGISKIVETTISDLAAEIYADVLRLLPESERVRLEIETPRSHRINGDYCFYKANNYNLLLLGQFTKIKIFLGLNAIVAKENYTVAKSVYPNYTYLHEHFSACDKPGYRIELNKVIPGITPECVVSRFHLGSTANHGNDAIINYLINETQNPITVVTDLFLAHIIDLYYSEKDIVVYPNDNNICNFIITNKIKNYIDDPDNVPLHTVFVQIDWDHVNFSTSDAMVHNVAWQFFGRIYDEHLYSDDEATAHAIQWRKERTLHDRIKDFKEDFYRRTNQPDRIGCTDENKVDLGFLNNSSYLAELVNNSEAIEPTHKGGNKKMSYEYLKLDGANPMFEKMADVIKEKECTSILDLGCGYSRINEFLDDYEYTLLGVDNDLDVIAECNANYDDIDSISFTTAGILDFVENDTRTEFDCVVLSGLLYYFKQDTYAWSAHELISNIVKKYNPKTIIISEPRPSVVYKTSDLSEIFSTWAYESWFFELDIRMGDRVVYALETDRPRSIFNRKIKAEFNSTSEHSHQKETVWKDDLLSQGVYLTNTETLDDVVSGNADHYISVSAGFKSLYQACMDWYPEKDQQFTYIDVVPTAIDYRMYFDQMYPKLHSATEVFEYYQREINPAIMPIVGDNRSPDELDTIVDEQLSYLNISRDKWNDFIEAYSIAPKTYIRVDAVNDIKILNKLISKYATVKYFNYSNIHDWHQFRFTEETFYAWHKYLADRNNITFVGKIPPFTSM